MQHGPLKLKIQIFCGDEIAMGPGKADLLEAIEREGSISAAGRALGMSYRRSWLLVDAMNRCWTSRLVETLPGGGQSRGAVLTEDGKRILATYRTLEQAAARSAEGKGLEDLRALLRETPIAPAKPPAS